jgi:DNA-binding MarR family transcriptional regulator
MVQRDITNTKQAPIGYWLKHVDELITKHADQVLSAKGFTRHRWQVLNIVYEAGTITIRDVSMTMKTFIDAPQLDEIIDGLVKKGLLVKQGAGDAAELALTEAGKAERETIFKLQSEVRRRAVQGVTEEEYATVIDVLQRMARNLEETTTT